MQSTIGRFNPLTILRRRHDGGADSLSTAAAPDAPCAAAPAHASATRPAALLAAIMACAVLTTGFTPTAAAIEPPTDGDGAAATVIEESPATGTDTDVPGADGSATPTADGTASDDGAVALPDPSQPATIEMGTAGSKDTDKTRTQQYFQFENGDWTGWYIRPGITAKFRITLDTEAETPNVLWAHRQAGRVDSPSNYAVARADDGGKLAKGANEITYDTTARKVGQVLLIRNDGGQKASVTIENMDGSDGKPSLGRYPLYVHDEAHPEAFWTYLRQLRAYVDAGVDTSIGQLNDDPSLGMDMTSLVLGRMVYDLRAARMVDSVKDIADEAQATAWIENVNKVSNDRLDYFDGVLGFDAADTDPKQLPTRMKVVLEMTQNLAAPSTMFAWYTMYHLPEGVWPGVATSVNGSHGWGNDHEFGHMLDIAPLARLEETNNLVSMWGRREAGIDAMADGSAFTTSTYHSGVLSGQKAIDAYLDAKAAGEDPTSPWGDIWYDVTARFNVLRFFDDYDYSGYDFANSSGYTRELADQVAKYGGLGAVYRQVRRTPRSYTNVGGVYDSAARAYSDALGFDMSEVMGRYGMAVTDATKEYTAKYPKLGARVEYFSIDSDAKGINGAGLFGDATAAPAATASRAADGGLSIRASYPDGSAEAKTVTGYTLLADGKEVAWSRDGSFSLAHSDELPEYTVVAWDRRANPSPEAAVRLTADVAVRVATVDGADVTRAVVKATPDDTRKDVATASPDADGLVTFRGIGPSTITVELTGHAASPSSTHVDTVAWAGGEVQFTLSGTGEGAAAGAITPRPAITGTATDDGSLAFTIADTAGGADIYYTTDGSDPSAATGLRWGGGSIAIASSPVTVKAIAYKAGMRPSEIASATFTDARTVTIYDAIYGPAGYGGNQLAFGVGEYRGADQLGKLYENVRSLGVPAGLKVTMYTGENLDGDFYTYTSTANWVNGYNALPIKSIKVETVKAPAATAKGTLGFLPGADDATGTMPSVALFDGVAVTVPESAFTRPGWQAIGWTDGEGNVVAPGAVITPSGADMTLTATWERVTVRSIAVATPPTKGEYMVGESFSADGLTVRATMSDGTSRLLESNDYTLQGFDASAVGTTTVTVALRSDPTVKTTFEVTVTAQPDTVAPVFAGVADTAVEFGASFDALAGVSASDDVDGDVTASIKVSVMFDGKAVDAVDTKKAGDYTLTYTVSDAAGNEASARRTVTVKAKPAEPDPEPEPEPSKTLRFTDVTAATPHHDDIQWLGASGISTGWKTGETATEITAEFRPMNEVIRQDMAAFLYRLAGEPAYTPSAEDRARFTDVSDATPHAKEIWWLASKGISTGFKNADGTYSFGGDRMVVRQDMAAFLKRLADVKDASPSLGRGVTFTDLAGASHVDDIQWLAKTGVTTGWKNPDGKTAEFRGMNVVVRQDMAAFLHRMSSNVLK